MGRPSKKTPELIKEICLLVAQGKSILSIGKMEGMPDDRSIWTWLNQDEEFLRDYTRAIQARAIIHAERIDELAEMATRGEIPADVARVAIDAKKWTASRLLPKLYGDRTQVEATVNHTHTLHLEALKELADRARGTRSGYIEGQATEIIGSAAVLGGRVPSPIAPPEPGEGASAQAPGAAGAAEAGNTPPAPTPGGGRVRARPPRSVWTKTTTDHPPTPPAAPKPSRAKNRKGSAA